MLLNDIMWENICWTISHSNYHGLDSFKVRLESELGPVENLGAWNGVVLPLVAIHLRRIQYVLGFECQYVSYRGHDHIDKDEDKGGDGKDDPRPELRQLGCVLLLHLDQVLHRPG